MTRYRSMGISLAVLTLTAGFATADEKPKEFATEQHKQLDALAGTWDVTITSSSAARNSKGRPRANRSGSSTASICTSSTKAA